MCKVWWPSLVSATTTVRRQWQQLTWLNYHDMMTSIGDGTDFPQERQLFHIIISRVIFSSFTVIAMWAICNQWKKTCELFVHVWNKSLIRFNSRSFFFSLYVRFKVCGDLYKPMIDSESLWRLVSLSQIQSLCRHLLMFQGRGGVGKGRRANIVMRLGDMKT